jgi:hypothetical protein
LLASTAFASTAFAKVALKPKEFVHGGRTHVYQIPEDPKGVVVMFPGCARTAYGFWPKGGKYLGFPEDVSATKQVLLQKYAMLVLTPQDTRTYCWSAKTDSASAKAAIDAFKHITGLTKTYVMGASSGGGLAFRQATYFGAHGVVAIVSTRSTTPRKGGVPVVYVTLARADERAAAKALVHEAGELGVRATAVYEDKRVIDPGYFARYFPVTTNQSKQLHDVLVKAKVINEHGTFLRDPKPPGSPSWPALASELPWLSKVSGSTFRTSGVWQSLLVAYGGHEHTGEHVGAAIEWLDGVVKNPQAYAVMDPENL